MFLFPAGGDVFLMNKIIKFNFDNWPMPLSGKIIMYICHKCKYKIEVPIEAVKEWEEDMWDVKINLFHHMVYVLIVNMRKLNQ